jgi:ribosomal protein S18 acetylase RimI-like enzyme
MTFRLRPATEGDAAAISDLFHRSFTATFGHLYPPEDLEGFLAGCSIARFRAEIASPDFAAMLGESIDDDGSAGRLLGYCLIGPQDLGIDSDRRGWVLRQLYLEDVAKGSGLAQELIDWAIAESRARNMQDLYLTVWVDNHRARRFYDRQGFVEVGSYAFKVGNTVDDDRILKFTL